jgi:uncharacterized protein YlxW (UPF0749 family)
MLKITNTLAVYGLVSTSVLGVLASREHQQAKGLQKEKDALVSRLEASMQAEEAARQKLQKQVRDLQDRLWQANGQINALRIDGQLGNDDSLSRLPSKNFRQPTHWGHE